MSNAKLNVWVVDDDQSVRWVLEKALRQADMEARSFERAEHLLEAIETTAPDVLITDVRMPGMSGIALLERLRDGHPDLPIIIISTERDKAFMVEMLAKWTEHYITKPFREEEVIQAAEAVLGVGEG